MEENNKSYYAIIPADIRYDFDLTPNAKLLYSEITALCNEKGYCWATNDYFAQLYQVSKISISKWINQLEQKGYITTKMNYKEGTKQILNRYITILKYPIKEKFNTPIKEKFKDNNTIINNTFNIKENIKRKKYGTYKRILLTDEEYEKLTKEFTKDFIDNQINLLDEYIESNNNKNKYSNWNLVLRKSIRENWFKSKTNVVKVPEWLDKEIKKDEGLDDEFIKFRDDFARKVRGES